MKFVPKWLSSLFFPAAAAVPKGFIAISMHKMADVALLAPVGPEAPPEGESMRISAYEGWKSLTKIMEKTPETFKKIKEAQAYTRHMRDVCFMLIEGQGPEILIEESRFKYLRMNRSILNDVATHFENTGLPLAPKTFNGPNVLSLFEQGSRKEQIRLGREQAEILRDFARRLAVLTGELGLSVDQIPQKPAFKQRHFGLR